MARPSVETERREQILGAACRVIARTGFRVLRISDVAREAGVSTGSVHYYFDTKRDLMHAAFEWNLSGSLRRREALLAAHEDVRARLTAFVDSYLPIDEATVEAWRVWAELWVEALHDADLAELNDRIYDRWRQAVAGIVRDGQAQGVLRASDPEVIANVVVGLIDGLALQVLVGSGQLTAQDMRRVCHSVLADLQRSEPATGSGQPGSGQPGSGHGGTAVGTAADTAEGARSSPGERREASAAASMRDGAAGSAAGEERGAAAAASMRDGEAGSAAGAEVGAATAAAAVAEGSPVEERAAAGTSARGQGRVGKGIDSSDRAGNGGPIQN